MQGRVCVSLASLHICPVLASVRCQHSCRGSREFALIFVGVLLTVWGLDFRFWIWVLGLRI